MKPHCLQNNDSKTHKLVSPIIVNINTDLFGIFHRRHIFIGAKKVTVRFRGQTHFSSKQGHAHFTKVLPNSDINTYHSTFRCFSSLIEINALVLFWFRNQGR
jgi:hypothetical protein